MSRSDNAAAAKLKAAAEVIRKTAFLSDENKKRLDYITEVALKSGEEMTKQTDNETLRKQVEKMTEALEAAERLYQNGLLNSTNDEIDRVQTLRREALAMVQEEASSNKSQPIEPWAEAEKVIEKAIRPYVRTIAKGMAANHMNMETSDIFSWASWIARRVAPAAYYAARGENNDQEN